MLNSSGLTSRRGLCFSTINTNFLSLHFKAEIKLSNFNFLSKLIILYCNELVLIHPVLAQ